MREWSGGLDKSERWRRKVGSATLKFGDWTGVFESRQDKSRTGKRKEPKDFSCKTNS